jgi:mannan endo-1,4-beta-mannosidase
MMNKMLYAVCSLANFWAWGGEARPRHQQWLVGDPYLGDPAQEQQGLNSVFSCDSTTIKTITRFTSVR